MSRKIFTRIAVIILIIAAGLLSFILYRTQQQKNQAAIEAAYREAAIESLNNTFDGLSKNITGEYSRLCAEHFSWELINENEYTPGAIYSYSVKLTRLDLDAFFNAVTGDVQKELEGTVSEASRLSDVYDDSLGYLPEITDKAIEDVMDIHTADVNSYIVSDEIDVTVVFSDDAAAEVNADGLDELLLFTVPGKAEQYAENKIAEIENNLQFIPLHYSLPETADCGYIPDPACYGETEDPEVIKELLNSPYAQLLLNGREPVWSTVTDFVPGKGFKYYLDETILVLVWYEPAANACGTYMEVFLSDASQLCRKLSDDNPDERIYTLGTELSAQSNAVAAMSGDLYDHWQRIIGVCVNDGEITRYSETACDMCWITGEGNMLLTRTGEVSSYDEALEYIKENDITFSLCFGPALIIDGVNVTPDTYTWGEVNEDYPRCAIAQVDSLHYLSLAITSASVYGLPDWGCTVKELGIALMEHNVQNAYTLDGGQTGEIIFDDVIVSPFGYDFERGTSDIIYFASALPDEDP